MAVEVYELMMKLGLDKGSAMEGLTMIETMLKNLAGIASGLQANLQGVATAGVAVGTTMAVIGGLGGAGLNTIANASAEATEELNILKNMIGEVGADQLKLASWNAVRAIPGSLFQENLKLASQMAGFGMEPDQIAAILPDLVKVSEQLKYGGRDVNANKDVAGLIQTLGRTGMTDPGQRDKLMTYIDNMSRAVQASGGAISAQDYMKAIRFGGIESMGWSNEFVRDVLPKLILDFKAGGGGMAAMQGNIGMLMSQAFKETMQGELQAAKGKGAWDKYGLGEMDISSSMLTNPMLAAQAIGPKLIEAAAGDTVKLMKEVSELFTNPKVAAVMYDMISRLKEFDAYAARTAAIDTSLEGTEKLKAGSPAAQMGMFANAFKNFTDAIGEPLERIKLATTGPMVNFLNAMSNFVTGVNPETMDSVAKAMWAVAGGLILLGGTAALGGALLLAPGGAVTVAIIGLGTAIAALVAMNWGALRKEFEWWVDLFTRMGGVFSKNKDHGASGGWEKPEGSWQNQSFNPATATPPTPTPISLSLNVDGRQLAQSVSQSLDDYYNHPTGAGAPNGWNSFRAVDSGTTGA